MFTQFAVAMTRAAMCEICVLGVVEIPHWVFRFVAFVGEQATNPCYRKNRLVVNYDQIHDVLCTHRDCW